MIILGSIRLFELLLYILVNNFSVLSGLTST